VVVLVPTMNNAADLERCLASLAKQTYAPFRVHVVDGNSNDHTHELVKRFGYELFLDTSSTRADACNNALRSLSCDIVVFTDDDCYPPPTWLASLVRHFSRSDVDGVGGPNVAPPDQGFVGRVVDVVLASPLLMGARYGRATGEFEEVEHNSGCNAAYRKSVLDAVGGFPTGSVGGEDVVLDRRIRGRGYRLWFDPEALTWHRRRDNMASLARQMHSYGRGKVHITAAFRDLGRLIHWAPVAALVGFSMLAVLAATALALMVATGKRDAALLALIALPVVSLAAFYLLATVGCALSASRRKSLATIGIGPCIFAWMTLHIARGQLHGRRELQRGRIVEPTGVRNGGRVRGR
jgi:cellulose synthase/poly-beta-1,6-N-acetylglucosamine synthase-like glycosyltransferase